MRFPGNPSVPLGQRVAGVGLMLVGLVNVVIGLVLLMR